MRREFKQQFFNQEIKNYILKNNFSTISTYVKIKSQLNQNYEIFESIYR